jgi:hypothetical protein
VERTLLDTGQVESVYQMRRSFQLAMGDEFRRVVAEATGRKVIAYMSSIHVDPDLAVEVFVLEPLEETDPAPDGNGEPALRVDANEPAPQVHGDGAALQVDGDGAAPQVDGDQPG